MPATRIAPAFSVVIVVGLASLCAPPSVDACGGFFCQLVPIDQAGEQIIFRQDGNQVTAVVLIQYEGQAEDFSWVVPAPGVPDLSVGSTQFINQLEVATRPRFVLDINGEICPQADDSPFFLGGLSPSAAPEDADGGVQILERVAVGPFDAQVVTSDDPDALATWLDDNDYDLTDRGRDLIAPYVEEGLNFVALRLRQNQDVGDIQPLIMRYQSDAPMIPIRLTAVAAMPDMGVVVWLLGSARSVPLNYLHVVPNYTRLNWYTGTLAAYAAYQGLITAAMNEAGGQGFATDFAGRDLSFLDQIVSVADYEAELARLAAISDDAFFVAELSFGVVFPRDKVLEILGRQLPLPAGEDEFLYQIPELLTDVFTADAMAAARPLIVDEIQAGLIDPLAETLAVFDGDPYVTRLYTTLSPEEMTLDPLFSFNPDLADQSIERRATMDLRCDADATRWTLTLGPGTGRDGEVVIEGTGLPPSFTPPAIDQDAVWQTAVTGKAGPISIQEQKTFDVAQVIGDDLGGPTLCGAGIAGCGAGLPAALLACLIGLRFIRSRR